ncbi:alpha/beta hydrolase [Sphingobium lactosutens]|uniref:alpha/beta hydrolase family protein n=1 Tax=Sphingobium lactosutens TaxID=522773 RepID=UPI0015B832E4|nr:alpha/beta hydrolase [Sphingobium lactosutens]NWK97453.1 alpha/beta hydrolase [Sphingobium lactosutens]
MYDISREWAHITYPEESAYLDTYGFSRSQGMVNLEGILVRPRNRMSRTLLIYMHPSATMQLLPAPTHAAAHGAHILCAGSRYPKNDSALIMENVARDLGAWIRHAREVWNYRNIVLAGWSGGGSLSMFYQAQAENPTITHTPAGDAVDLTTSQLIPADAVVFQAAHLSRAQLLADWIDPSVLDELNPDVRDQRLDIYDPNNPVQPPYDAAYIAEFREAQRARVRKIAAWARGELDTLQQRGGAEVERGFVIHRTMADPRFIDSTLDPNGRRSNWCYLGNPETVNNGPAGLARFSTLRSFLSQWSIEDTNAHAPNNAPSVNVPMLAIENGADDAVPQPHTQIVFDAVGSQDKQMHVIEGATHYYAGQPELLSQATTLMLDWLRNRNFD